MAEPWSTKSSDIMPEPGKDPVPVKLLYEALERERLRLIQYWGETSTICRDIGAAMMGVDEFYFDLTGERLMFDRIELVFHRTDISSKN